MHHASPGDLWWAMSKASPYVHQVCLLPENTHSSQFFAMEILRPPPVLSSRALEHRCYRLRREDSRPGIARVYDLRLDPGESTGSHRWNFCGVILCLEIGEEGRVKADHPEDPFHDGVLSRVGGWKWINGPVDIDARNTSDRAFVAIVAEWLGENEAVDGGSRL